MGKKNKKKKSAAEKLFLAILIMLVAVIGYLVFQEAGNELAIMDMEKKAVKQYVTEPTKPEGEYGFDWDGLQGANEDVVGWLRFEEPSRINYPIVQGETNQEYLNHDWQGNYLSAGAIFLSAYNNPKFTDANSILYGHRMINGSMFGSLKKYGSQEFLDAYPYFYIYTPDGKKRTYEIFAYAQVQDGSDTYDTRFETAGERMAYYEKVLGNAITKRSVELDEFDTTAVLSTCASRGYYDRMVVLGKLVKIEVGKQP